MRKIQGCIAAAIAILSISSCEETIDFNGDYDGEKLVLFSCANPGASFLSVRVSKSRFFLKKTDNEADYRVKDVTLTLTVDGKPVDMVENPSEPGTFLADVRPAAGSRLLLNASSPGFAPVSSETTVPSRPDVEIVPGQQKIVFEDDRSMKVERHFTITVHDNPSEKNYYVFSALRLEDDAIDYNSTVILSNDVIFVKAGTVGDISNIVAGESSWEVSGAYDDSAFDGKDYSFDVWIVDWLYKYEMSYGEEEMKELEIDPDEFSGWGFEVDAISEDMYKYMKSLSDYYSMNDVLGAIFAEPVSIHNNVKDGIGCFGAVHPLVVMF